MDLLIRRIRTKWKEVKMAGKFMILKCLGEKRKQIMDDNAYKRLEIKYTAVHYGYILFLKRLWIFMHLCKI